MADSHGVLDGVRFCSDCKRVYKVRVSDDIYVHIHWVCDRDMDFMLFDVLLVFEDVKDDKNRLLGSILYREVYK